MDIIFRCCSRVFAFHGGARVVDVTKSDLIERCLRSLIHSAQFALQANPQRRLTLTVIDDHSDVDAVRRIHNILGTCQFPHKFIPMTETTGNGASMLATYLYAKENCEDLIYFVEDDYLHDETAINEMLEMEKQLQSQIHQDVVIFPCDHPDFYKKHYPSGILLGSKRYWRNIGHTTGTMMLRKKVLLNHWDKYMAFTKYGIDPQVTEDTTINLVYRTVPCFSPMPTLAVHMGGPECISPYVDWKKWWEANQC